MKHVMIDLLSLALLPAMLHAGVWRWSDQFIASFVDAEGINLYPGSPQEGEEFDGQMLGVVDVPGPGVEVHYRLTNTVGQPVDNSVAGIEAWKPDGADWLGLAAATGRQGGLAVGPATPYGRHGIRIRGDSAVVCQRCRADPSQSILCDGNGRFLLDRDADGLSDRPTATRRIRCSYSRLDSLTGSDPNGQGRCRRRGG